MTTTVRSVDVRLNARVTRYIRDINRAGDATEKAFDRVQVSVTRAREGIKGADEDTDKLRRSTDLASPSMRRLSSDIDRVQRSSDRGLASIDKLSGRVKALAQLGITLGPGAIPIGGVAVAAVAGLANQLAVAGLAGGTLLVAMNGVVDATKALDEYQLDPTAANLERAEQAMAKIGPEARQFVLAFQDFQPMLGDLRDAAAAGWFPGLTEALDDIERLGPRVLDIVSGVSEAGGDLIARGADSLASARWDDFFEFLEEEAPDTLTKLGRATGSTAHALSELWMAFDPLNDDFSEWLVDSAESLDEWASRLEDSQGFQDFMEYVQQNGPQVGRTLAAFAQAGVDIVQAMSPLGGPVLEGLETVAELISAIAGSPLGPKIFTMAAAFVVLNKVLAITSSLLAKTGFAGAASRVSGAAPGASGGTGSSTTALPIAQRAQATVASFKQLRKDIPTLRSVNRELRSLAAGGLGSTRDLARANALLAQRNELTSRSTQTLAGYGKTAALAGGGAAAFAVASGAVGQEMGLQNTAMLGLVGSMSGPWGAAIGAGIGLTIDLANANKKLTEATKASEKAMNNQHVAITEKVGSAITEVDEYYRSLQDLTTNTGTFDVIGDVVTSLGEGWSMAFGDGSKFDKSEANIERNAESLRTLAEVIEGVRTTLGDEDGLSFIDPSKLYDAGAFLKTFGDNAGEVQAAVDMMAPAMDRLGISIQDLQDAAPEEMPALIKAISDEMLLMDSAAGRTQNVVDAFADLDSQFLTTAASARQLTASLDTLLSPQINVSRARDEWITSLRTLKDELAGTSRTMVGNSEAAIQNREAIRSRVERIQGVLSAEAEAGASSEQLSKSLRKQVRQLLDSADAADLSRREVRDYISELNLTPELIKTLIRLNGMPEAEAALARLTQPRVVKIQGVFYGTGMGPTPIPAGNTPKTSPKPKKQADGGTVPGDRYPYADKVLTYLAPGEEVITNRNGEADRFRADRAAGRIPAYANGGTVQGLAAGGTVLRTRAGDEAAGVTRGLAALRRELAAAEKAVASERKQRDQMLQRRTTLRSGIRDGLDDGIWRPGDDSWTSEGPLAGLRANIAEIQAFDALTGRLKKKGVTKGALDAILAEGDLATAQAYAGMSKADLATYVKLYTTQQRELTRVSARGADAAWGTALKQSNAELQEANAELKQIKSAVNRGTKATRQEHAKNRAASRKGAGRAARGKSMGYMP